MSVVAPERDPIHNDFETLLRDGIVGLKGAFSRDWAEAMREDMTTAFWKAIQRPGGAVGHGPGAGARRLTSPVWGPGCLLSPMPLPLRITSYFLPTNRQYL